MVWGGRAPPPHTRSLADASPAAPDATFEVAVVTTETAPLPVLVPIAAKAAMPVALGTVALESVPPTTAEPAGGGLGPCLVQAA